MVDHKVSWENMLDLVEKNEEKERSSQLYDM